MAGGGVWAAFGFPHPVKNKTNIPIQAMVIKVWFFVMVFLLLMIFFQCNF